MTDAIVSPHTYLKEYTEAIAALKEQHKQELERLYLEIVSFPVSDS
ncbi:hypothetical protein [Nostoc sp.]